jgi:hypothetical protein
MDISVDYQTYLGALLATNLFSSSTNILLGSFGPNTSGTLSDASGLLYVGETVSIDGTNYTMLGSGTAQPGINVLGLTVPTGTARDLVLLENQSTGDLTFVYPDGVPSALGMIALVINVSAVGYNATTLTPLCFAKGTGILTTEGIRPVQTLTPWDTVIDLFGDTHPILATSHSSVTAARAKATGQTPCKVVKDAIAPGVPSRSVMLSPNHNVFLPDPLPGVLAPVKTLIDGEKVKQQEMAEPIDYYHIVLPVHAILLADGLPAESLLLNDTTRETLSGKAKRSLNSRSTRPFQCQLSKMTPAARVLTRRQVEDINLWL